MSKESKKALSEEKELQDTANALLDEALNQADAAVPITDTDAAYVPEEGMEAFSDKVRSVVASDTGKQIARTMLKNMGIKDMSLAEKMATPDNALIQKALLGVMTHGKGKSAGTKKKRKKK